MIETGRAMQNDGPTDISAARALRPGPGRPEPLGVTPDDDGVNVAVFSAHAEEIAFCLYDSTGQDERARIVLPERSGDVFHGYLPGIAPGARYGLRARGPFAPWNGHRFNDAKLLVDPYAMALDRHLTLHPSMFDASPGSSQPDGVDSGPFMPKAVVSQLDPALPWSGAPSWQSTSVMELHVRGFSMQNPEVPEALRGTFSGLASPASIAHLKALGLSTLELMPAMAWADERHLGPLGLTNYWGYNPIAFMAPDPRLAPGGWAEVRAAVASLNAAGIEVLLDVVFNHSGEGDEFGPTLSLRGLDNASYYRLDPSNPSLYVNDAGCGNILAADQRPVVRLVLDSLRAWARYGGINGFRFDLMPILGRHASGFDPNAPIIAAIEQDPLLRGLKLVAEPWDIGPGGYQVGAFDGAWAEWNDRYRDDVRRFWTGRATPAALATRISGSSDLFWSKRHPSRSINFVTAHDGFTLADLVSYDRKHNDENGEHNRDGRDENWSWNHGVEGPTDDAGILAARERDQRNLLATLFLSRGTPMLSPGSEMGQTQGGNNNAYSQDNALAWIDWSKPAHPLIGFIRRLIALRTHPALTRDHFLSGTAQDGDTFPDVVWRMADGRAPNAGDWDHPANPTLIGLLSAPAPEGDAPDSGAAERVVVVFHAGADGLRVRLPDTRSGAHWRQELDTADDAAGTPAYDGATDVEVAARSVSLFVERGGAASDFQPRTAASSAELVDRLALSAGIAPEWFEVSGDRHEVSIESKRALLASMGLGAGTVGEARDSLARLSGRRLRALPGGVVGRAGSVVAFDLIEAGGPVRPDVVILHEDGTQEHCRLDLDAAERSSITAPDGRKAIRYRVSLPPQPVGRHRLMLDGDPEGSALLTVAPPRGYIPPELANGRRDFGVSAHLYTLRRKGDGGIGDFTTLGVFAEETARHGATFVGLNPMHAQFAGDRSRTSPYNPSDRRFLDPIYIDVAAPEIMGETPEIGRILDAEANRLAALRTGTLVDYPGVWTIKAQVLEAAFAVFDDRRTRLPQDADVLAMDRFVLAGGVPLRRFAVFEALSETLPRRPWWTWDEALRGPDAAGIEAFAARHATRVRFHLYLQWLAAAQLARAAGRGQAAGLGLGFYRDIAVGTAPDGAEAWAGAGYFARGVSIGAPPDPFSADGQVWSLPPPNPVAPASETFSHLLAINMRHAGALRIDHAMGLQRLFWVPDGAPGSAGAYVGYDLDRNLADIAIESHRARCLVIGEDLGTVPEGFRDKIDANDVLSYRVMFFERDGLKFLPPKAYPEKAVACVATHDLPTLAGWWKGADFIERGALGKMSPEDAGRAAADRGAEKRWLVEAIEVDASIDSPEVPQAVIDGVHRFVAETPSLLAVAQADDLVGEAVAVNLPGTNQERPNWQRKLAPDVTQIFDGVTLPVRAQGPKLEG